MKPATWALVSYLMLVGAVGLWATAVDVPLKDVVHEVLDWLHSNGFTMVRYGHLEAVANLALFLPLGFLLALAIRPRSWWWVLLIGLLVSASIETAHLAMTSRTPQLRDVLFNTAGAFFGAALCRAVWRLRGLQWRLRPRRSGP